MTDTRDSFVNVKPVIVADTPDAHQVWLDIGVQHFTIGEYCETKDEAEWLASQLRIALANTASQSSRGEAVYQIRGSYQSSTWGDVSKEAYDSINDDKKRVLYTAPGVVAGEVEFIAHKFWGAGEADCPKDIKSSNGELHTLRCKVCGKDNNKEPCKAAITVTDDMVDVAYEAYADMYDVEYTQGSHIDNRRACIRAALTAAIGRE